MAKFTRKTDIRYIRLLFIIANVLALIPRYDFRNFKFCRNKWSKLYALFFLGILIAGFVYTLIGKIYHIFPSMQTTILVVNVLASSSFFIINTTALMSANFWNFQHLDEFMRKLVTLDRKLAFHHARSKISKRAFILELVFNHVILLSMFIFDFMVWEQVSVVDTRQYIIYDNLQKYHTHILVYIMVNFILCIKHRYNALNEVLKDVVTRHGSETISFKFSKNIATLHHETMSVRYVIKMFTVANEMVDLFNKIYGWIMLYLNINIIATFLVSLDFIIEYTSESAIVKDEYGFLFIILMLLWTFMALILGVALASTCDKTTREAYRTSTVTYRLLQHLPLNASTPHEREMREDLLLLSEQVSLRTPSFSAAGFFNVDYTMLFTMLGSITSYLVVLIQFS